MRVQQHLHKNLSLGGKGLQISAKDKDPTQKVAEGIDPSEKVPQGKSSQIAAQKMNTNSQKVVPQKSANPIETREELAKVANKQFIFFSLFPSLMTLQQHQTIV